MPDRPATWDDLVRHEAQKARVPFPVALAVMQQESGGNPDARSPKGAIGLMQLLPSTASGLGVDPADPIQNIRGGLTYLRQRLDAHEGNLEAALADYHAGPDLAQHGPITADYVKSVLGRLQARQGIGQPPPTAAAGPAAPVSSVLAQQVGQVGQPPPVPNPQGFETRPKYTGGLEGSKFDPEVQEFDRTHPSTEPGILDQLKAGADPRTPEGRRNLAGATGAMAGAALTKSVGGARTGFMIGAGSVAGAAAGGGLMGGADAAAAGDPVAPAAASGALEQGLYDAGGQILMWPIAAVGKRVLGSRIAKSTAAQLETAMNAARATLKGARGTARAGVQGARDAATARVAGAKTAAEGAVTAAQRPFDDLVGQAPSAVAAGKRAVQVITGPAKSALDELGAHVGESAKSGPAVNIRALKAEAQRVVENEIAPPATAFPREPIDVPPDQITATTQARLEKQAAGGDQRATQALQDIQATLAAAQDEARAAVVKHPAMGVLGRILNAEDDVPFAAAHEFKRDLDEAVGIGGWDQSIRKRVTNVTKTLRGTLRAALGVHQPYNEATAAYAQVAPLFSKGMVPRVRKLAIEEPEAVVRLISPKKPTETRMLRDVLLTQAEAGGGRKEGQAAWDSVRSAWTHRNLLTGGVEKVVGKIDTLDPDFAATMYGDLSGQAILTNLRAIGSAYEKAVTDGRLVVERAKTAGKAGVRSAQRAGEAGIETARGGVETARQTQRDFSASSLPHPNAKVAGETTADVLRLVALGPTSFWGGISAYRLLSGPKSADLLRWASYSPTGTQLLVKALNAQVPDMAIADVLRASGIASELSTGMGGGPNSAPPVDAGTPPPAPGLSPILGTPPPTR